MSLKDEILQRVDFLSEYRRIGVQLEGDTPNEAGWVSCHAIDRTDKHASAAINTKTGYYVDLGGSGRKLDFFSVMQLQGGFGSFKEVLDHYADEFGLTTQRGRPKKDPQSELDVLPWNPNGDRWCGIKKTTRDAVERAGGFLCRYKGRHICVGFQVYAGTDVANTEPSGYVVLPTDGGTLPRYDKDGQLVGSSKCKLVAGTVSGLIGTEALLAIQKAREAGTQDELTVFKVEGVTDLTALLARIPASQRGRWLVLTNASGAGEKPKASWGCVFEGLDVVVVHDADTPGRDGARNWCRFLQGKAKRIRDVILPYEETPNHGKDLKDYLTEESPEAFFQLVAATAEATPEENALNDVQADDPHRLAIRYLRENHAIPGHPEMFDIVYQQNLYYQWKDGYYDYLPTDILQARLTLFCRKVFVEDCQREREIWIADGDSSKAEPKVRKVTIPLVSNVLNFLKGLICMEATEDVVWRGTGERPEGFEDLDLLIPLRNGVLHLGRLESDPAHALLPSTPLLFTRYAFQLDYQPEAVSQPWCEMVEWNLIDTPGDDSKVRVLQEFLGYCLIPDTKMQKFLLLVGEGSNGKSAILTAFSTMFGTTNIANVSLELFSDKFALAQLRGKLVNAVDDLSETDKVCEGRLKSVVSGMPIHTDRKNLPGISFTPMTRLIFACNALPRFRDHSDGILRRMVILTFRKTIPEGARNTQYTSPQFWEQEKSGIFNWCLSGLLRLRANGFHLTPCRDAEREKTEYAADINPAAAFIAETLTQGSESDFIPCFELYRKYSDWCFENGVRALSSIGFGKELRRHLNVTRGRYAITPGSRSWVYIGIVYQNAAEPAIPF